MLRDLHRGPRRRTLPARPTGNAGWKGSRETGLANRPAGGRPDRRNVRTPRRRSEGAPNRLATTTASRLGPCFGAVPCLAGANAHGAWPRVRGPRHGRRHCAHRLPGCATLCDVPPTPPPERAPLPDDPWSLPAPGPDWDAALAAGLDALGLDLSPGVRRALDAHSRLLIAWTAAINLTARPRPGGRGATRISSTACRRWRRCARDGPAAPAILDLGSGGGFPGLPLAAALPAGRVALVDSIAKKVRFLDVAGRAVAARADRPLGSRRPASTRSWRVRRTWHATRPTAAPGTW